MKLSNSLRKICIIFFTILTIFFFVPYSQAYEVITHVGLTNEVVDFYNLSFKNKITNLQKELIIQGSIDEDSPDLRVLNHFYDPIRNIGLLDGHSAKDWAISEVIQKRAWVAGDYSWPRALQYYADGDEVNAFKGLGHIIHLIEDMATPDHTRNDSHLKKEIFGVTFDLNTNPSPYEWWAREKNRDSLNGFGYNLFKQNKKSIEFFDLAGYFDFMALYSNQNFFSKDTIAGDTHTNYQYENPKIIEFDKKYGYGIDSLSEEKFKLVKIKELQDGSKILVLSDEKNTTILQEYFTRLSTQAVLSGAGIIDLFLKEAKQARKEYLRQQEIKQQQERQIQQEREAYLQSTNIVNKVIARTYYRTRDFAIDDVVKPVVNTVYGIASGTYEVVAASGQVVSNTTSVVSSTSRLLAGLFAIKTKETVIEGAEITKKLATETKTFVQQAFVEHIETLKKSTSAQKQQASVIGAGTTPRPIFATTVVPSVGVQTVIEQPKQITLKNNSVIQSEPGRLLFVGASGPSSHGSGAGLAVVTSGNSYSSQQSTQPSFLLSSSSSQSSTPAPAPLKEKTQEDKNASVVKDTKVQDNTSTTTKIQSENSVNTQPPSKIKILECAASLITDGCLTMSTTAHISWEPVSGVDQYVINKNGTIVTTKETSAILEMMDFSDYTVSVSVINAQGQSNILATQVISVASMPIVINEIAWMGTAASSADEWFELKNNTKHTIDLSKWEIKISGGAPSIKLIGTIAPHAYIVFERTNDDTISDSKAHQIYTGSLNNTGEQITLLYASATIDQTPLIIKDTWVGGENSTTTKKTMERYSPKEPGVNNENWGTNLGFINNGADAGRNSNSILGTPGKRNSISHLINKGQPIEKDVIIDADEGYYVIETKKGISVSTSSTLTIKPGVVIAFYDANPFSYQYSVGISFDNFDHNFHFNSFVVNGRLIAEGTEKDPIVIKSSSISSYGLEKSAVIAFNGGNGTSLLSHIEIKDLGQIIVKNGARLDIRDATIMNSSKGIRVSEASMVNLKNIKIINNFKTSVRAHDSTVSIDSSKIQESKSFSYAGDNSLPTIAAVNSNINISNSEISGPINFLNSKVVIKDTAIAGSLAKGDGIVATNGSDLMVVSSTIKDSRYSGIVVDSSDVTISNTLVENGQQVGISIYSGDNSPGSTGTIITDTIIRGFTGGPGIRVTEPAAMLSITGGEITGNQAGIIIIDNLLAKVTPIITGIHVHNNPVTSSVLNLNTQSFAGSMVGKSYTQNLDISGGILPYTSVVFSGMMPPGLNLTNNILSGTPTTAGDFTFVIQVTDSSNTKQTVSKEFTIHIAQTKPVPLVSMVVPVIKISECAASLVSDGCLITASTVQVSWDPIPEADQYVINKNGTIVTTKETSIILEMADFTDYMIAVSVVDMQGNTSVPTTQKISIASVPIVINEIAWMGTEASFADEWFELKNNTGYTIDLSTWSLQSSEGTQLIKFTGIIAPNQHAVFERTNDDTIKDSTAHQIYTGSLENNGEQLTLYYRSTSIDQTPLIINDTWAAGENIPIKKTMERRVSKKSGLEKDNWGTNLGSIKNGTDAKDNAIMGSPGARNSVSEDG